jgi:hypothetical protein
MMDVSKATVSQLQAESNRIESLIGEMAIKAADARVLLGRIRAELEKRLRPADKPMITDHALLRYIERVLGVDVAGLRAEILNPNVIAAIAGGASSITKDGVKFVVKGNALVTVIDAKTPQRKVQKSRPDDIEDWRAQVTEHYAGIEETKC